MSKLPLIAASALALTMVAGRAHAQTDMMATARQMAANQLGVMEYCHDKGFADADAVKAQQDAIARLPPAPSGSPSTADAEALGRKGTISANGTEHTLASMADGQHTTVSGLCGQMASAVKQASAMSSSMPKMPVMPGGMPAMPNMPSMPGMPPAAK